MKTTDSTPHNYVLPYNVNYRAPFRFVMEEAKDKTAYTCTLISDSTDPDYVKVTWRYPSGADAVAEYTLREAKHYIEGGDWLVLDEQPASFRFTCKNMPIVFTYNPLLGMCAEGSDYYAPCSQQTARDAIANGVWTLLPSETAKTVSNVLSTQTAGQAESAAFEVVNSLVKPASKASTPTIQGIVQEYIGESLKGICTNITSDGNTTYFIKRLGEKYSVEFTYRNPEPTWEEDIKETAVPSTWVPCDSLESTVKPDSKASTNNLLDVIKNACITSKGRIAVTVYPDHYEVYHRPLFEDCLSVDEKELEVFLTSLLVIDRSGNWDY